MSALSYTNRELSWLEFNQRVIEEAKRKDLPLLEQMKFLAISGSNLDEFYQVRIGGMEEEVAAGQVTFDPAGLSTSHQLDLATQRAKKMMLEQDEVLNSLMKRELPHAGIQFLSLDKLSSEQKEIAYDYAMREIHPILSPYAINDEENVLSPPDLQICVICKLVSQEGEERFCFIPIPSNLNRFVSLNSSYDEREILLIENAVVLILAEIFPLEEVSEYSFFRLTKNKDIILEDEESADLAKEMSEVLTSRRFGRAVRVEVASGISESLKEQAVKITNAQERHVVELNGALGLNTFMSLAFMSGFEHLRDPDWKPRNTAQIIPDEPLLDQLEEESVLLIHPYESFDPVVQLLEEAAKDPEVLAIKQVLYRTASKSRIIEALKLAAQSGKQVTVLVELKARFDESRNLMRAAELQRSGVQVVYGVKGLKTHAKATLIIRKKAGQLKRFVHLGTGNYNESTATLYTDISYLSADTDLGIDTALFFNMMTGRSRETRFIKLRPAPTHMKRQLLELIDSEANRAKSGEAARILAKINSLQDPEIIKALYVASQAGVEIKLNVRGICCLQPGVEGVSENIEVVSIIDRYLEHARVFSFYQNGDEKVFISSADWMVRNLEKRLELMVPIEERAHKARLIDYLEMSFKDNTNAYQILADGSSRKKVQLGEPFRFQERSYKKASEAAVRLEKERALQFQPHKPSENENAEKKQALENEKRVGFMEWIRRL